MSALTSAARGATSQRPGSRWRLSTAVLLAMIVGPLAAACDVTNETAAGSSGAHGEQFAAQPAVALPGVQSCSTLKSLAPKASSSSATTLSSRTLSCLSNGPAVDVAALGGKPVVINLWASWCGPCRDEMPILESVSQSYRNRVAFIGVDTKDSSANAAEFIKKVGVNYPQLSDPGARFLGDLRSPGLPVTVILNADGTVSTKKIGQFNTQQELTALLDQSLNP